jgi:integrase
MLNDGLNPSVNEELPPLAQRLFLPDCQVVNTETDPWMVHHLSHGLLRLKFSDLGALSSPTLHKLKLTMAWLLESRSALHVLKLHSEFKTLHNTVLKPSEPGQVDRIILAHLLNYRERLGKKTIWQLGRIRILLELADRLGYGFCSSEVIEWFNEAVIPGNEKGVDVRTRNPKHGAFTAAEVETLNAALNDAYAEGKIDITDYAIGNVLLAFGVRSIQLAMLKEKDLIVTSTGNGQKKYILRIPQAKQPGQLLRASFRDRPCDRRIGLLLEELIKENCALKNDPEIRDGEWPMFIAQERRHNPPGFAYHRTGSNIARRIRRIIEAATKISANSKRFRHTLAQNMADDGASKLEIAEALGHADTQQVGVYIEARPELVSRLNNLAGELTPIMQAFAGRLISSEDIEAQNASQNKRLHDRTLTEGGNRPLGHCGQHSFCDLAKPNACYTCRDFRPWDDGPHEEMLCFLLKRRQSQIEKGIDRKIYSINDRTISAVRRVVQLCTQRRAAPSRETNDNSHPISSQG